MIVSTSGARHLLLRLADPARLPEAMLAVLRDEIVLAGWMRASGVLSDVQIQVGSEPSPRKFMGPVHAITLEGSVGLAAGDVSCGLRIVAACAMESGDIETVAGELLEARVNALEVHVTAFDDVVATRQLDRSGVWLLNATSSSDGGAPPARPATVAPPPAPARIGFGAVVRASEIEAQSPPPSPPSPGATTSGGRPQPILGNSNAMPTRIAKPVAHLLEEEEVIPEAGDVVEHFAFGRCDVVKSDGDRLHVRLPKDQRVKEIALEMLKVTRLDSEEGQTEKRYKLSRKL